MRGDYGFDAPAIPLLLGAGSLVLVVLGVLTSQPAMVAGGVSLAASMASFVYTTRRGKLALWRQLLARFELRGDERVLDMGCVRGAVLVAVAHLVPSGRVVGVDLWRTVDQSGNREEATAHNAALEGVAERVELYTGDMTAMAYDSDSFDVVLSSLAVHNVKPASRRREAVDEAVRVLKPGGRLVVADIQATGEYARRLRELGMADVVTLGLGWRGWYGGPWMAISAVTAGKPGPARS